MLAFDKGLQKYSIGSLKRSPEMQSGVSYKVSKNAEPGLAKGSPKVQSWAPKGARQQTKLVLTRLCTFRGPFYALST